MADPKNLPKVHGIRKSYLRNIINVENEVLRLISNNDPKNENQKLKLLAKKNILLEKIEKVKTLDENVIDLLNGEAMEMELDESLARNDNFHWLFVKIDMCLKTLENELRNISLNKRPPSSADSETGNFVALLILAINAKEIIILQSAHTLKTRTVLIPLQLQIYQTIQTTFSCKPHSAASNFNSPGNLINM